MTFLFPLGLLGLIGIPILIIVYIIKQKYTEQTVASTYIWTLSEKFLKRRNPFSRITGLISLILQILAIALVSIAIAHPIFAVPGAAYEYCFVLDGSASMRMEQGGVSRFDKAKEMIAGQIQNATNGSRFSLIYAGSESVVVFEELSDKEEALKMLDEVEAGYDKDNVQEAVQIAQNIFNDRPSILTSLYTDTAHIVNENIQLVDVSGSESNLAIDNVSYSISDGVLTVMGDLVCHDENGGEVELYLYVDGAQEAATANMMVVGPGETARFQLTCALEKFSSLRIEALTEDNLGLDDEIIIYDIASDSAYTVLIVSDYSFFLKSALQALGHSHVEVATVKEFEDKFNGEASGYGLYIFDGYNPAKIPSDGAVWVMNPVGSSDDAGFSVQSSVNVMEQTGGGGCLDITTSTNSLARALTEGMDGDPVYISSYVKCGLYRNFTTIYSYKGTPVIFAGTNSYGNREVVFALDIHHSNLPLMTDFIILLDNCMEYSFPTIVEKTNYYVGETAQINMLANCDSVRVESPLSNVTYLDVNSAVNELKLTEAGTYTITAVVEGKSRQFQIHTAIPGEERVPMAPVQEISIVGQSIPGGFDGEYDPLIIVFICLAVIFAIEWGVYCYEKRQLR